MERPQSTSYKKAGDGSGGEEGAHRVHKSPGLASPVRVHGECVLVSDEVPDQVELGTVREVEREDKRGRGDRPFKARVRSQGGG